VRLRIGRAGAALFDMDGVLIDTDAAVAALWQRVAAGVGRELTGDEVRAHVIGCTPEHTLAKLFSACSAADQRWLLEQVRAGEPGLDYQPLPGAARLVRALAAAGVPLALVTSASAGRATAVTDALGVTGCFTARVTWGDAKHGKPDPEPYLIAAFRLGVRPADCTVFEDSVNGVRAAVAAGAACIGVDRRVGEGGRAREGGRAEDGELGPLRDAGAATVVASLADIEVDRWRDSA
jgi:HAD superfamily hydrolase (TIGR01509 family)